MLSTAGAPLLERAAELGAIDHSLAGLRRGTSSALLIEGPAGIGKTRLLAEAQARAAGGGGARVLRARAGAIEVDFPWGVARQLFEPVLVHASSAERDALVAEAAALALPALGGESPTRWVAVDEFPTLHGLYWLTVNLAGQGPLMLTIDDLHWCDLPSLRFLAYLVARLEGLGVLALASTRTGEAASPIARELIARLALERAVRVVKPLPLTPAAAATIVREQMGDGSDREFCDICHELTGGNPFLLSELLTALAAEDVLPVAATVAHVRRMTPQVVSRSVLLRLSTLPGPSLSIARAIAVLGASATPSRAARLAGVEIDVAAESLAPMVDANILRDEHGPLTFVHPIVGAAVYEDISSLERARWHERAARMLADQHASPAELTSHLLATAPSASAWAVGLLRAAAVDAGGRGAAGTAVACLRRALQEPPQDDQARIDVLVELGRAEALIDPVQGCRHLREALQAVDEAAARAAIALALGRALAFCDSFPEAVDTLHNALTALDHGPPQLRASLQAELLNAAHWDSATRPRAASTLAELERDSSDGHTLDPRLHAYLAFSALERGESRAGALAHARRALDAGMGAAPEITAIRQVVTTLAVCDELDEAEGHCRSWLLDAQQEGHVLAAALASSSMAIVALLGGRISDALAHARQSLTPPPEVWTPPFGVAWLVEALVERGAIEDADCELTARGLAGDLPRTLPFALLLFCRGRMRAAAGQYDHALADLLASGEIADLLGIVNPAFLPWRSTAALALLALGRRAEASELADDELARARLWGTGRALGVALRASGLVQGGRDGIERLQEAAAVLEDAPAPLERARALIDLGAAVRRSGERRAARELLRSGLDLADQLGGLALADRARRELRIAGARPRRDALRGRDALTPSELRIARMAAEGLTNRQIAQALFVTLRTVELHLTNAYAKLSIRKRTQLGDALENRPTVLSPSSSARNTSHGARDRMSDRQRV